jgi:hypothetical protein
LRATPRVRFARSGGVDIAYQVVGVGPIDLVFVEGFMSHRQVMWEPTLVSGTVRDLVAGSGLASADRGTRSLKGVPDEWRLFALQA